MSMSQSNSDWEALPPRKSRRSDRSSDAIVSCDNVQIVRESGDKANIAMSMESNLAARTNQIWAQQSLESKDGCAGEFYEYLDHTADVQLHAWGESMEKAFENIIPCMFNYMTDLSTVAINPDNFVEFTVSGDATF